MGVLTPPVYDILKIPAEKYIYQFKLINNLPDDVRFRDREQYPELNIE